MALFAKLGLEAGPVWVELPYRDIAQAEAWLAGLSFGGGPGYTDLRLSRHPTEPTISTEQLVGLLSPKG